MAIAIAIALGVSIGMAPTTYCAILVLTYLLADRFAPVKPLAYLAAVAWLIALSDCMVWLPLQGPAAVPDWVGALLTLLFSVLGVFYVVGALPLWYVAVYAGADVQNALLSGRFLREGAVFAVWGGVALVLTATAWMKSREPAVCHQSEAKAGTTAN
jgi:hypothetical protein